MIQQKIDFALAKEMLIEWYQHPKMDLESVLNTLKFKSRKREDIIQQIDFLRDKYRKIGRKQGQTFEHHWIMSQLRGMALGNMNLSELSELIKKENK
jgi:Glu-tRNA(Gln) amidotransferase subunit E-like FAD-binding protein